MDNDVLAEGLKFAARDPTDTFEATSGMHCNRYSLGSLKAYMNSLGYAPVSGHIFAFGMQINKNMWGSIRAIEMAAEQGYPIVLQRALLPEYYDLTGTLSYMLRENIKSALPEWAVRCVRMCLHPGQIVKFGRNSR